MAYVPKKKVALNRELASYVMVRLERSRTAWAPEYRRMLDCCRLMRGLPYLLDDDLTGNITFPVIPTVTLAVLAAIQDIFGSTLAAPFTLQPDPDPDIPPDMAAWLVQLLQQNLAHLEQVTGGDPSRIPQALQGLRASIKEELRDKAADAAKQMTDEIKTRLQQGGWQSAFEEYLNTLVTYPVAVMRGPTLKTDRVRRWNPQTNRLEWHDGEVWAYECVNPFHFYPAPFSKDVQQGEYMIEVRRLNAVDFAYLSQTDGYDAQTVLWVQQDFPDGVLQPFFTGDTKAPDYDLLQNQMGANGVGEGYYDVVCFHGRISGKMLNALAGYSLVEWEWYEAAVEVCGNYTLRAELNPNPSGRRPFAAQSLFPVPGSFFGECIPTRLLDTQRACEAAIRSLIRNMAWSSGPFVQVDINRVAADDDPTFIEPGTVKFTKQTFSGQNIPAYRFDTANSNANELNALLDSFVRRGFMVIGMSELALSGTPAAGVGRTSGGMSISLNQAAKPLKLIVHKIGSNMITPVIQDTVDKVMMTSTDTTVMGDINVHPTGVEGLADDEAKAGRIQMALQNCGALAQFLANPQNPLTPMVMHLFYTWLQLEGISTQGLPQMGLNQAFAQDTGAAYAGASVGAMPNSPAPPMPALDGRSAAAAGAITQSNNPIATMGGQQP